MKCPACERELRPSQVNGVQIGTCRECFGSFCYADFLRVPVKLALPANGPLRCPACRARMLRGTMFKGRLKLDRCPECAGVWFEAYEIGNFREYAGTEPIGAPEDGTAPVKRIDPEPAPAGAFPWTVAGGLVGFSALYAIVIQPGDNPLTACHRELTGLLLPKLMAFSKGFFQLTFPALSTNFPPPGAFFKAVLDAERIVLWSAIALLAAYSLNRVLAWALPAEELLPGSPPAGWGRHKYVPADFHADADYTACAVAAKNFVAVGEKAALLAKLSGHCLPTVWLEAYRDTPLPMLRVMAFTAAAVPLVSYLFAGGRGASTISFLLLMGFAGMLLGFLLSCFIFAPILARLNRRARLKLIARWEGRHGTL